MDLGFAISELKLKFEREYRSRSDKMLGVENDHGRASSGERWKRENEVFYDVMAQHLEHLFNSVEVHISYLTNGSARDSVEESEGELVHYVDERIEKFMKETLDDRGQIEHFQTGDDLYQQMRSLIESEVKHPLDKLLKNRFNKVEQIIEGRPDPLWNRPWASHALSALMGAIVGAASVWMPKLVLFITKS